MMTKDTGTQTTVTTDPPDPVSLRLLDGNAGSGQAVLAKTRKSELLQKND